MIRHENITGIYPHYFMSWQEPGKRLVQRKRIRNTCRALTFKQQLQNAGDCVPQSSEARASLVLIDDDWKPE